MENTSYIRVLSLQLFADGSAGGTGTGANSSAAGNDGDSGDLSNVRYGIDLNAPQEESAEPATEKQEAETFDSLIKGKYKADYDRNVQDIVQRRVRGMQATVAAHEKAQPLIDALAQRYGMDSSDIDGILKAFDEDDQMIESQAEARNMPTDEYRKVLKMERENKAFKREHDDAERQRAADQIYNTWMQQAEEARKVYPSLDLRTEMQNPEFANLIRNNVSVKAAYQVIHGDEIMAAGMQYATQQAQEKVARSVAAGAKRPVEGGNGSGAAAVYKSDVSSLTSKDFKEIQRRVSRGEKISFG